jgi:hypothetical protein
MSSTDQIHTSHRTPRGRSALRWTALVAAAATGVLVVTQLSGGLPGSVGSAAPVTCAGPAHVVNVVVAPEVRRAVTAVVAGLNRIDAKSNLCRRTTVQVEAPGQLAARLRAGGPRPDVWVPDSTLWVSRAGVAAAHLEGQQPSVASTPVAFAVPAGHAVPGLDALLDRKAGGGVRLGLPHPDQSAVTAGALLALEAAAGEDGGDAHATLAATLSHTDPSLDGDPATLLNQVARAHEPVAVAVTEQAVTLHNAAANLDEQVDLVRPAAGRFDLDFPVVAMSRDRRVVGAALRLVTALHAPLGQELLQAAGLEPPTSAVPMPPSRTIEEAVRSYFSITRGTRMLAVFDVSGSMGALVPGAGGATRMDLARRAAAGAMPLLPPGSEVGLWEFATKLVGRSDHRELVPLGPLDGPDGGADRRAALALGVAGLQQIVDGGTGLYDTTLAAVRAVRRGWDPDRVNSVVLLTDGRNDDTDGIDLATLLAQLRAENDPQRPVPVISLVYGPDADAAALRAISHATGGATYVARDPRQVGQIMLDAFGRRACRPAC